MDEWHAPNPMKLFLDRYKHCVVHIVSQAGTGDLNSATGFHVGDGIIVTARHVVQHAEDIKIFTYKYRKEVSVDRVILSDKEDIDLALLLTKFVPFSYGKNVTVQGPEYMVIPAKFVPLGGHLDDWIGHDDFLLTRVLVLGYPPIPSARDAVLVGATGEVNATIDRYNAPHVHFIISPAPRGGLSGAPVISEYDFLLGVVTESMRYDDPHFVNQFMAIVSVEPLLGLLADNGLFPDSIDPEMVELFRS